MINRCLGLVETYFTVQTANKLYSDEEQDLIFCYDGELTGFLLYSAKTSNKQLVYGRLEYSRELPSNTFGRKIKRYIENWLCKKAISKNRIKFVTHMEDLDRLYAKTGFLGECKFFPPFAIKKSNKVIDKLDARSFLNLPKDKTILLVFGIGHSGKSYETIVRTTKNLNSNCKVLFAGRSLPANDAKLLSKKYNCEDSIIIFDKYISDTEHPYFFYAADYVILSYKKEFFEYSAVLLDAIKYGLPVIACDAFWIGKMVKTNGLGKTFATEDPNSLEKAIEESLLLGEDKKDQIRKKMKSLVEENSMGKYC